MKAQYWRSRKQPAWTITVTRNPRWRWVKPNPARALTRLSLTLSNVGLRRASPQPRARHLQGDTGRDSPSAGSARRGRVEASLSQSDRTKMNVIRHPSEQHPVDPVYAHEAFTDWFPKQGHVWN